MTQLTTTNLKEPLSGEIPSDLHALLGERALITLALQAVDAVAARLPRWQGDPDGEAGPRMLLTLLTYCYAAGTYASEDVEWACRRREGARYICGNTCPDQDRLRHFRRANRPWIEECLAWVLERVREQFHPNDRPESGQPPEPACLEQARGRVKLATLMDMALAD